jgi:regulator of nucleoside diphosphate kinase
MQIPQTASVLPELHITEQDMTRLRSIVERYAEGALGPATESLELELDRARVVPQDRIPADVVTMRSRAVCQDVENGKTREVVLVYPDEADVSENKVSVLAPMGLALLGLRVGDTIRWPMPRGRSSLLELVNVRYQPEAAGALDL